MILQSVLFSVKSSDNKDLKELLLLLFFNIFYFSEREVIKNDNNSNHLQTQRAGEPLEPIRVFALMSVYKLAPAPQIHRRITVQ